MDKKSVLIFGVGELQKSIINRAKLMGLFVVGIDPCADAVCREEVDAFEIVGGQDFEGTLAVAKKYNISAVVTAATDKPLVMMARIAKELGLKFFSEDTAIWSTDKFKMKQRFIEGGIPCAKGRLISNVEEAKDFHFPVIVKPRDNSGSRGVIYCNSTEELKEAMNEALQYSKLDTVLVEEFIEGQEYSIESLHYDGKSEVIQFTEKTTTPFPYNVELGHKQPANLSEEQKEEIRKIISNIAECMNFENCPSHTELKINERGIFIIETSPRLGGDYITSTLVPLSTGINIEDQLLNIALNNKVDISTGRVNKASAVCFFNFPQGVVEYVDIAINGVWSWPNIYSFEMKLNVGDRIKPINSSLDRYGQFVVFGENSSIVADTISTYENRINHLIKIQ
ncbi:MAG: ATP-grasp domain-containing protein [Bacteroidales bacterium]|nr:ATP-grasp domain-containing protein [Bacteroidales bacterium]